MNQTDVQILALFFGRLPGQSNVDLLRELRELSEAERLELAALARTEIAIAQGIASRYPRES